jgi:PKD repeat protein
LFPYETFNCAINCDKTAVFSYTDSKKEIQSILWNFGDGTEKSAATSPIHFYKECGKYTVTLTINFSDGQTKTLEREIVINSQPEIPKIICE